ncbi:hypothetical protein A9K55_008407 [Cordyceps militaris]|uniref:Uncharacterized protein n=1 Tax=Cordyceps militaris TaxID=73501 RepID=A0A2H4SG27_CORMI|nr:hypothetical protein A9K55_008407 [Cordyceps militaris]
MSAFAGAQGYEALSSAQQRDRAVGSHAENGFARTPCAPPPHLCVVVSVPAQSIDNAGFRGRLHDVSAAYQHAVHHAPLGGSDVIGDALMGSRLYAIRLGTMAQTIEGLRSEEARYTVQGSDEGGAATLALQRLSDHESITIDLSDATDDYSLVVGRQTVAVTASFPVPDSVSSAGSSQHPFYTFTWGGGEEDAPATTTLQWQIQPLGTGPLRYTLVRIDAAGRAEDASSPAPESIRAIYHHTGQAPSLSLCSGQGVLLLPEDGGRLTEAVIVASLLGLLWRVRAMQVKPLAAAASAETEKKSILRRLF